jgi:hypothetical protein
VGDRQDNANVVQLADFLHVNAVSFATLTGVTVANSATRLNKIARAV